MSEISTLSAASAAEQASSVTEPSPGTPNAAEPAEPAGFRQLMGSFPTGVSVITAVSERGPRGMTCSSLTSVCLEPPTLAVCLNNASSTLSAAAESGRFAVNLLHSGGERAARVFASAVPDRFDLIGWLTSPSGLPWLAEDAFAIAECRLIASTVLGDHTVVFGEVTVLSQSHRSPLVYGRRSFRSWDELGHIAADPAA